MVPLVQLHNRWIFCLCQYEQEASCSPSSSISRTTLCKLTHRSLQRVAEKDKEEKLAEEDLAGGRRIIWSTIWHVLTLINRIEK